MSFNLRPVNEQAAATSNPPVPSGDMGYFADPALLRAAYSGLSNIRWLSGYFPNPNDSSAVIRREMEKVRIRDEIILAEIVRRRMFDEELQRELMLERHATLSGGADGFLSSSTSMLSNHSSSSYLLPSETRSLEEKLTLSLEKRSEIPEVNRLEGSEPLQFQRSSEPKVSTVKLLPFGFNKEKPISMDNPTLNLSGLKRKAESPMSIGADDPTLNLSGLKRKAVSPMSIGADDPTLNLSELKRKAESPMSIGADDSTLNLSGLKRKVESPMSIGADNPTPATSSKKTNTTNKWNYCAICQIVATCKENLEQHFNGKKHKSNMLKLRQKEGKNCEIGFFPKTNVEKQEMKTIVEKQEIKTNVEKQEMKTGYCIKDLDPPCIGEEAELKKENDLPLLTSEVSNHRSM